ncbi:uncharacterized protein LOC127007509 [Eriocheir sinensis]|uniref:uncharacterized protein LOC127007509 n=1 Tax=Eriocheir sinensis TaxID=95602 RepID=UPI0021C6AF3F|nr:uncharacterized protein LOC127007509 [Eriocheir sinensis]XP_050734578.1 uncharacterized protein LOC127007509 [Eriocheir sinensis]XP_050734579.1 uncharacterized protein LOC127007509 [Eriocheir sinensis]
MASQQIPRAPDAISDDEMNILKLMKMAYHTACSVLYRVFIWGTQQEPGQTVEDYLLKTKGYSRKDYKKFFDRYQIDLMSDKSLEPNFDISTLSKIIRHTCGRLDSSSQVWNTKDDNRIEWLVTEIKDFRNDLSHNFKGISAGDLFSKATELMNLLKKTLDVAGALYEKSPEEICEEKERIAKNIETVMYQNLAVSDISEYEVIKFNEKQKNLLKEEGRKELEKRYERLCQLNPVDFLENNGLLLDVNMIFTQIEVENAGRKKRGLRVPCQELITFCRSYSAPKRDTKAPSPEAYLLEGPAGAGKTTLIKYIKGGWSKRSNNEECMLGLDEFDLILFMECRNTCISSFSQLLSHLMPETSSKYFRKDDLLRFTLVLKTLILVDGLDELNSSSEKLFLDIINQDNSNFVIFCTSRPEKIQYFTRHVPPTFHTAHLKIIGIADNRKEDFIRKYHGEMQRQGMSKQDTESLINYIKKSESHLQYHYRLPLNLVLLTWLWADDPDSVSPMTTSSELYIKTHDLMKKKLVDRLAHREDTHADDVELEERIKQVLYSIYEQALYSLSMDTIESLLPQSVKQMKATCEANKLPYRETLSAFFVIRIVEGEEKMSVPHKMLCDFYAAQCIVQNLFNKEQESKEHEKQKITELLCQSNIDPVIRQMLLSALAKMELTSSAPKPGSLKALVTEKCLKESTEINKFQTMLLQVAGIIYALHGHEVKEWIAKEIVDLLKDSELGVKDDNQWFDLIDLAKNNHDVITFASNHITKAITITEQRVATALHLLLTARPKKITLDIISKATTLPSLEALMNRIADCECDLDLAFWQDFSYPASSPSNDQELRIISKRCNLGQVVFHVSGGVLAEIRGTCTYLSLAVTSNQAAQEVLQSLRKQPSDLVVVGLCLHLTTNVSPEVLSQVHGIIMLSLVISGVHDDNINIVCDMAKALQPQNSMLLDMRFPQASVTYAGCVKLLKSMKAAGISSGHISIPENVLLRKDELEWLKEFAFDELPVRSAFRRLSEKQMWGHHFLLYDEENDYSI